MGLVDLHRLDLHGQIISTLPKSVKTECSLHKLDLHRLDLHKLDLQTTPRPLPLDLHFYSYCPIDPQPPMDLTLRHS